MTGLEVRLLRLQLQSAQAQLDLVASGETLPPGAEFIQSSREALASRIAAIKSVMPDAPPRRVRDSAFPVKVIVRTQLKSAKTQIELVASGSALPRCLDFLAASAEDLEIRLASLRRARADLLG